jgi:hypothetical protein
MATLIPAPPSPVKYDAFAVAPEPETLSLPEATPLEAQVVNTSNTPKIPGKTIFFFIKISSDTPICLSYYIVKIEYQLLQIVVNTSMLDKVKFYTHRMNK